MISLRCTTLFEIFFSIVNSVFNKIQEENLLLCGECICSNMRGISGISCMWLVHVTEARNQ
jgi:hypothetical protein